MKQRNIYALIWCVFFIANEISAISLVYNIKIRRVFNTEELFQSKKIWALTAVPIIYKRDRHIIRQETMLDIQEKRFTAGSLFNVRYVPTKSWWFELTTGVEKETVRARGTLNLNDSRAGFDDIIFSGGHNFFPNKYTQFVLYGLAGFPSKRTVSINEAQDTLVGTRFFSAGLGSELSYSFFQSIRSSFTGIFQNRFIHFFSREWFPILPRGARIEPGNLTDLLFSLQYRLRTNIFETGYNPTFFTNQGVLIGMNRTTTPHFIRHSGYLRYSYFIPKSPILCLPLLLGTGFNIGRAKFFDTRIFLCWLNFTAIF